MSYQQSSLSEILPLQHANKSLKGIIDSVGYVLAIDQLSGREPLRDIRLVFLSVLAAHTWVADNEALITSQHSPFVYSLFAKKIHPNS